MQNERTTTHHEIDRVDDLRLAEVEVDSSGDIVGSEESWIFPDRF